MNKTIKNSVLKMLNIFSYLFFYTEQENCCFLTVELTQTSEEKTGFKLPNALQLTFIALRK